jgi:hypothetical protein
MAISRPFLLAVLGAVLLGATVLAVQNARDNSTAAPAALQAKPAPAPAQQTATSSAPTDELQSAFKLSDVKSGRFAAKLSFGAGSIGVAGAFDRPAFAATARLGEGKHAVKGGLVSLGKQAYFVSGDTGWRIPGAVWGPVVNQKLPIAVHPSSWARDVKSEGTETVGGVETEHLSGSLDTQAMFNDLAPAVGKAKAGKPKSAEFDVWVAKSDHLMRRLTADVVGPGRARMHLDVRLSEVNNPQHIKAPAHVKHGVPAASVSPFAELIVRRADRLTGTKSASLEALTSPNPGRAARAVHHHQKVVILFRNKRGLDDRQMVAVMHEVDRRTKALVLVDPVDAVDRYGKLVQDLGVSETPSVVIIDRKGKARLIEGYVDATTLTQAVSDAR